MKYLLIYLIAFFAQSQSILVVTEDAPPLQIYKNGELTGGMAVKLVQAIFKQAKLTSDIQVYPWPRAYHMALTQKDTLIFSIAKSPERKDDFISISPSFFSSTKKQILSRVSLHIFVFCPIVCGVLRVLGVRVSACQV